MINQETSEKMQRIGFILLRIGMALVFIWFGTEQLIQPKAWTGFVPTWAVPSFLNVTQMVLINGLFEIVASSLLILNVFTRFVALLLALHLIGIAATIGINPIGVRDLGLAIATFSLSLLGPRRE